MELSTEILRSEDHSPRTIWNMSSACHWLKSTLLEQARLHSQRSCTVTSNKNQVPTATQVQPHRGREEERGGGIGREREREGGGEKNSERDNSIV